MKKLTVLLSLFVLLNACGAEPELNSATLKNTQTTDSSLSPDQHAQIVKRLDDIRERLLRIEQLKLSIGTLTGQQVNGDTNPVTPPVTEVPESKVTSEIPVQPAKETTSPTEKGRQIFSKIVQSINNANGIEALIDRYEHRIEEQSKKTTTKIQLYAIVNEKKVKMDVLNSSAGGTMQGAKVVYNSGQGDKVKLRPGGALSLITTDLSKTDDRLLTLNKYRIDDIDIFGLIGRLSGDDYEPELVGTTTVNNEKVYLLKIKAKAENSLDPRIEYEYIGFNPQGFQVKLWEAYAKGENKPFFRLSLNTFEFRDSIPADKFKL